MPYESSALMSGITQSPDASLIRRATVMVVLDPHPGVSIRFVCELELDDAGGWTSRGAQSAWSDPSPSMEAAILAEGRRVLRNLQPPSNGVS